MPLNITVMTRAGLRHGALATVPMLSDTTAAQVVALGAQSTAIVGPCQLCLIADEDQRISAQKTAGYAAPDAAGILLKAGSERMFELGTGSWYINAVAG